MKKTNTLCKFTLTAIGALMCTQALAQDAHYMYGGVSLGQSHAHIDEARIAGGLLGVGLTPGPFNRDEKDTAYKLFLGYQMNPYFGLEAGYFDLGTFGFNTTTVPPGTLSGQIKLKGVSLDLVGTAPLTDRLSVIGRLGVQNARTSDAFAGTGAVVITNPNPSQRSTNYKAGLGMQYAVSPSFLIRGEVERYRINDAVGNKGDVNFVSVSLVFPFGRTPKPAPRVWTEPAPVVQPMPPAPVVMAPTPPPVFQAPVRRVSFSAETLFGFDKAVLRPEGKVAIDNFYRELQGTQFEVIVVEGHTDRLGSQAYNQRLSLQRAESVKSYLVTFSHIDPNKISVVAKGESSPVTTADQCKGDKQTPSLIACLQPDRRVDFVVTGTR
jgi:OmpA-OmpF porin, OOP family